MCLHLNIFQQLLGVDRVVLFSSTIRLLFNNFNLIFALRHIDIDICQSNMYREKNINKTRLIGLFSSKYEFTSEIKALMNVIRVKTSEATAPFDLMANKHKFTYLMDSGRSRDK